MSRHLLPFTTFVIILLYAGCDVNGRSDQPDTPLLRVANASEVDYSSVTVSFPGAVADFGAVASGAVTDYRQLAVAYHYGLIEVVANGDSYRLQPIDFVGEEPVAAGHYTYVVTLEGSGVGLELVRD